MPIGRGFYKQLNMPKYIISNFQALKTYGYNYYTAYIPSINKLREKLLEKSQNEEVTQQVLSELILYVDEQKNIHNYIRYYRERNKNLAYIKQKLTEKKFKKSDIESIISEDILNSWESILSKEYILKRITELKEKGKSKNAIRQKLIERKEDREGVEWCLQEIFWDEDTTEALKKALSKILKWKEFKNLSKEEKRKTIQKLLMRGFEYGKVKDYLSKEE